MAALSQAAHDGCGALNGKLRKRRDVGFQQVVTQIRDQLAQRTQDARRRRDQQAAHRQVARYWGPVHRARAAEGNQREVPRVVTPLD